jgi:hypothetical protein
MSNAVLTEPAAATALDGFAVRFTASDHPQTFVVPSGTDQVYLTVCGASGGPGSGHSGRPGRGGRVSGLFPVTPGETLTVTVGRASGGHTPNTGYTVGGAGGKGGNDPGANGGAGGGSTAVVGSDAGLLVEAGGGGGAGGQGNTEWTHGGDGGWGEFQPTGGGKGDGFLSSGGAGGKGGNTDCGSKAKNGGAANPISTSGGGGGGGGGHTCGGGGQPGSNGGGGGGGGGASFISDRVSPRGINHAFVSSPGDGYVAVAGGRLVKIVSRLSGLGLAVSDGSKDEGANIIQYPYQGDASQQWVAVPLADRPGQCKIVSLSSGLVLAVGSDSTHPGTEIVQWPYDDPRGNPDSRRWRIEPVEGGLVKIASVLSGLVLAVGNDSTHPGARIVQWPYDAPGGNGDSRRWQIEPLNL